MLATLSIENRIREEMNTLNITASLVGQLTADYNMRGFSQARISQALSGVKPFENHQGERLLEFIQEIRELVEATGAPLLLNNPRELKTMLDARRAAQRLLKDEGYDDTVSTIANRI